MGLGERLRDARKAKKMSQAELADKLGISINSVANYERGTSFPKEDYLYKILNLLEIDPNYLFQDSVNREFWFEERELLEKYRGLDKKSRRFVNYVVKHEAESEIEKELITGSMDYRFLCLDINDGINGRLREGSDIEKLKKIDMLPNADFLVMIRGNAEPVLFDGDFISVKYSSTIGELGWGLFNLDGQVCIAIKKEEKLHSLSGTVIDEDQLVKKPLLYGRIIGIHKVSPIRYKI